jgi:hypothetical protein
MDEDDAEDSNVSVAVIASDCTCASGVLTLLFITSEDSDASDTPLGGVISLPNDCGFMSAARNQVDSLCGRFWLNEE